MIKIRQYEDNDEYLYDLDERNFDDVYKCPRCGSNLIKGIETYSAYGSELNVPIWYCPECG